MAMSGSQKKKGKAANREAWLGDVETECAEPISQEAKVWVSQHLEAKLEEYGGEFTQAAAVRVTLMDTWLQRFVKSERLDMRAADVAWSWMAQQVVLLMGDLGNRDDLKTDEPKGRGRSWIVTIYEGTH